MRPLLVVAGEPGIEIGLQLLDHAIDLLAKRHPVERVEHGAMEALADSIGLRALRLGARVVDVLDREIELIFVALAAEVALCAPGSGSVADRARRRTADRRLGKEIGTTLPKASCNRSICVTPCSSGTAISPSSTIRRSCPLWLSSLSWPRPVVQRNERLGRGIRAGAHEQPAAEDAGVKELIFETFLVEDGEKVAAGRLERRYWRQWLGRARRIRRY
jgi:hypothetical protein